MKYSLQCPLEKHVYFAHCSLFNKWRKMVKTRYNFVKQVVCSELFLTMRKQRKEE